MFEESLIKQIKQYPILYNSTLALYRDHNMRNAAWEKIAHELDMTVDEVKRKWGKLRNCYTNALKRRRQSNAIHTPWKYERQLKFLLPFMNHIAKKKCSEDNSNVILYDFDSMKEEQFSDDERPLSLASSHLSDPISLNDHTHSSPREHEEDYMYKTPVKIMKTLNEINGKRSLEMDENDYFFLAMSKQIKKLPESDQADIKFKLHKLIYEASKERRDNL